MTAIAGAATSLHFLRLRLRGMAPLLFLRPSLVAFLAYCLVGDGPFGASRGPVAPVRGQLLGAAGCVGALLGAGGRVKNSGASLSSEKLSATLSHGTQSSHWLMFRLLNRMWEAVSVRNSSAYCHTACVVERRNDDYGKQKNEVPTAP